MLGIVGTLSACSNLPASYDVRLLGPDEPNVPTVVAPANLRLLTYNIRWGMGTDDVLDLNRIADVLYNNAVDVVILNEVDVNWQRSRHVDQPAEIVAATGYPYAAFVPSLHRRVGLNRGTAFYGNMILSRFPIANVERHLLPRPGPGYEQRSLLVAEVALGDRKLSVMGTHLGLNQQERLDQVDYIVSLAEERSSPIVLLGDFNALPGSREMQRIAGGTADDEVLFVDAHDYAGSGAGYTFPHPDPHARIDYVFVSQDLAPHIVESLVLDVAGSDHLPVLTTLSWPSVP